MASTIKLLNTIEWTKKFNFGRQSGLTNYIEPALTSANIVLQTILGPPFAWRWNRNTTSFTCSTTQGDPQDYPETVTDFGFIENASVQDLSTQKWQQMTVQLDLALDSATARPRFISAQNDNGAGSITFRVMPSPDQDYPITVSYQKKATLFTSLNQTWAPVPDEYSYIYNWGFLALMWMFTDDPRFTFANQKFVAQLLAANQGLTQTQINIFLNNWQAVTGQPIVNTNRIAQGTQARGI